MKKKITISALLLLMTIGVKAQDMSVDNRERFQMGVKFGASLSNVYDTKGEEFNAKAKLGMNGGLFFTIPFGKVFGLQPEVLLTQKGFKGDGRILGQNYSFKRTTTFLEVPILFAIKPAPMLTILVGPQYSYLLKQRDVFESSLVSYAQEQEFKNDNIRRNIFGVVAGLDINIENIVIGGRFGVDMISNRGDGNSETPRYRNMSGQITIGYKFF